MPPVSFIGHTQINCCVEFASHFLNVTMFCLGCFYFSCKGMWILLACSLQSKLSDCFISRQYISILPVDSLFLIMSILISVAFLSHNTFGSYKRKHMFFSVILILTELLSSTSNAAHFCILCVLNSTVCTLVVLGECLECKSFVAQPRCCHLLPS